jgi:hypothetical protein
MRLMNTSVTTWRVIIAAWSKVNIPCPARTRKARELASWASTRRAGSRGGVGGGPPMMRGRGGAMRGPLSRRQIWRSRRRVSIIFVSSGSCAPPSRGPHRSSDSTGRTP